VTWPEVLRWLALAAGIAASIAGLAWTLGRIFRPWMRNAARAEADRVSADVQALYERLKNNDFKHVEDRVDDTVAKIDRGLQDVGARIERVEARIGERLDRARQDRRDMEARILAAVERQSTADEA